MDPESEDCDIDQDSSVLDALPVAKENRGKYWFKRGLADYLKQNKPKV